MDGQKKEMGGTDVSVIVPLYYGKKYLPRILKMIRLNSIRARDELNLELILVNDSPDEVPENVSKETFPVISVSNSVNEGIQRSRIKGLDVSSGEYVLFLDQDDELAEDAVLNLFRAADGHPAASSDWCFEDLAAGKTVSYSKKGAVDEKTLRVLLQGGNCIGPPGHCLLRRDCIPECWRVNTLSVNGADDYLLWVCMLTEGRHFQYCNKSLYVHKYNERSCSADELRMLCSEQEAFLTAAKYYGFSDSLIRHYLKYMDLRREMYRLRQKGVPKIIRLLAYCRYPGELWRRIISGYRTERKGKQK